MMGNFIDLTGQRFGRLTVVKRSGTSQSGKVRWMCQCDCGKTIITTTGSLKVGDTKSCGCFQREKAAEIAKYARWSRALQVKHKDKHLYSVWYNMIRRCTDHACKSFPNYGGRGIKVCEVWINDFYSFQEWALESGYDEGLTIDRIDNDGNYEPENCRWASYKVQNNNYRRNVMIKYRGVEKTIAEWAEITGYSHALIWQRIYVLHWPIERALTEPVHKKNT